MIKQRFVQEYADLTTKARWKDLHAVFAVINDIGERLSLLEQITADELSNKNKAKKTSALAAGEGERDLF